MNDLCVDIGWKSINHDGEELCGDHVGDDFIRNEFAGVDVALCELAEVGAFSDFGTEDVSGGDVCEFFISQKDFGESSFSRSRRAEEHDVLFRDHFFPLLFSKFEKTFYNQIIYNRFAVLSRKL